MRANPPRSAKSQKPLNHEETSEEVNADVESSEDDHKMLMSAITILTTLSILRCIPVVRPLVRSFVLCCLGGAVLLLIPS